MASGAVLTLDGGTQIWGGPATGTGPGTLTVESSGQLAITGNGATLDGVLVTDDNTSAHAGIDVASGGILTLNDGTQINGNGTGTLTVESSGELQITAGNGNDGATPGGATLNGVIVTDNNTTAAGIYVASGATLTLDNGTTITGVPGATMTLAGTVASDGGNNTINNLNVTDIGTASNPSHLTVVSGTLTLSYDTFTFPTGDPGDGVIEITVDTGATLILDHTHIYDAIVVGTVNVPGDSSIEAISGNLSLSVAPGATLTLTDEDITAGTTIDDQGTILITTAGASPHGAIFDGVLVDDDTTTVSPAGIDVASGAILTLEGNTQILGGGSGTMTIESLGQLSITSAAGATLDGVIVTDNAAADGIDVASGAVLTLNDGTVISGGGALTVEHTGELLITAGSGVESFPGDSNTDSPITGRGATLEDMTVSNNGSIQINPNAPLELQTTIINGNSTGSLTVDGTLKADGGTGSARSRTSPPAISPSPAAANCWSPPRPLTCCSIPLR